MLNESFAEWLCRSAIESSVAGKTWGWRQASRFGDGDASRGCRRRLETIRARTVCVLTFPPHRAHGMRPIDVLWGRCFGAFCCEGVAPQQRAGQALHHRSRALRLQPSPAGEAQETRGQLVLSIIDTLLRLCGLYPYSLTVLSSKCIRESEEDAEMEDRRRQRGRTAKLASPALRPPSDLTVLRLRWTSTRWRRGG